MQAIHHWRSICAMLAGAACMPALGAEHALQVETIRADRNGAGFDIKAAYPRVGVAAIDRNVKRWVDARLAEFDREVAKGVRSPNGKYSLDLSFKVERNDAAMFAVSATDDFYLGGAHDAQRYETFNYEMPAAWRVYLPELFDGRKALARISALASAELLEKSTNPDAALNADMIRDGAGPLWPNFEHFVLQPNSLDIMFPPYQVGPYVAGPQHVSLPLDALANLRRKDVRKPVASFDCAKAASAIERSVCGDVELARQDRAVAAMYAERLRDKRHAKAIEDAQRRWLQRRDSACAIANDADRKTCLDAAYAKRIAELAPTYDE